MPESDLALLADAAQEAGRIALRFWQREVKFWDKGEQGPVSEADIAVNDMLHGRLQAARPGYGWLSEETPDDAARLKTERVFVIDPIDGTRAFIAGEDSFAVSIAVVSSGKPTAAAVYLPAKRAAFTRQGRRVRRSATARPSGQAGGMTSTARTSSPPRSPWRPENWPGGVPPLKRSFRTSLAYRLCLAAEGRFDGMLTLRPAWEWDIAAGALICERAGARVSDRYGAALSFNAPDPRTAGVVATAPGLHAGLIARLNA